METLSQTLRELFYTANTERRRFSLQLLEGQKTFHKGLSNLYSNHELDRGQNTLIEWPNTHMQEKKTLIESLAASLGKE